MVTRDDERKELLRIWDAQEKELVDLADKIVVDPDATGDYLEQEVLEIKREQYLGSTEEGWITTGYTFVTGVGGPHVEFTSNGLIAVYWGGDKWETQTTKKRALNAIESLSRYLDDIYGGNR